MANILYRKQKQQKSLDNGVTWIDTGEFRVGDIIENPSNCTSDNTKQCRWVELPESEGYYCDGYSKYTMQVEECTENGLIWTRTGNSQKGNILIDAYTNDCGFVGSIECINGVTYPFYAGNGYRLNFDAFSKNNYIGGLYYNEILGKIWKDYGDSYNTYYNDTYKTSIPYLNCIAFDRQSNKFYYYNNDIKVELFDVSEYYSYGVTTDSYNCYLMLQKEWDSDDINNVIGKKIDSNYNITDCELTKSYTITSNRITSSNMLPTHLVFGELFYSHKSIFHNVLFEVYYDYGYEIYHQPTKTLYPEGYFVAIFDEYCIFHNYQTERSIIFDKNGGVYEIEPKMTGAYIGEDGYLYLTGGQGVDGVYKFNGNNIEYICEDNSGYVVGEYNSSLGCYVNLNLFTFKINPNTNTQYTTILGYYGSTSFGDINYKGVMQYFIEKGAPIDENIIGPATPYHSTFFYDNVTQRLICSINTNQGSTKEYIYTICNEDLKEWVDYVKDTYNKHRNSYISFEFSGDTCEYKVDGDTYTATTSPCVISYYDIFPRKDECITNCIESFYHSNITKLNSYFDTSQVNTMRYMFYGCSGLTELDLTSFDMSNVIYIDEMFGYCENLTTLDVSTWDVEHIDTTEMFDGCYKLKTLKIKQGTYDWWYEVLTFSDMENQVTIIEV
jgi:surface protein